MSEAKKGSVVKVHYTGKLTDDTIFDSSREREPIEFTVGAKQMIEGFDVAVDGMHIGERKVVNIPSDKAYGEVKKEAFITLPKSNLPQDLELKTGMQLEATDPEGRKQILVLSEIKENEVVLDSNHPLAGKELIFDIELVEVN